MEVLKIVNHPHIIRLEEVYETPKVILLPFVKTVQLDTLKVFF